LHCIFSITAYPLSRRFVSQPRVTFSIQTHNPIPGHSDKVILTSCPLYRSHMGFFNILAIAIALAMDAFAVAISTGISLKQVSFRQTFRLSWHFGLFQAMMPVIGWGVGLTFRTVIEQYDHWVAFLLLALIGGNMIREAIRTDDEDAFSKKEATKGMTLVILSVATSIDALAVGFSMSVLSISIIYPALVIGIIAALFTIAGLHLGKVISASSKISNYSELIGGFVLLGIGTKILYEHGVFG